MKFKARLLIGGDFNDERGKISFVNDFDMDLVKRFYVIQHPDSKIIRAWQGHKVENKWFYCVKGSFEIKLIQISNWENPSKDLPCEKYVLKATESKILHIPGGYINGFRAATENSKLIVFSDTQLGESENDDFRFDKNLWKKW